MDLKNDWQESDVVMNTDMNNIANEVNARLYTDFSNVSGGAVPIANGGTGAVTAHAACTNLGALPLAGGTLSGQVGITYDYVGEASFTVTNPNGSIQLSVNNSRGLYDKNNSKWVVQSSPGSSDWTFNGTASNADTLDGFHASAFSRTAVYIQSNQPTAPDNSLWAW